MQQQIDINKLADFVLDVCDYSEEYEADAFVVDLDDHRTYVERKRSMFVLHVGDQRIKLPRS